MFPLAEWQTFLSVQATAAATLTGLVFVAVSINLGRIMAIPGLPGRAADSLVQLLQVFFVSTVMLVPRQPSIVLAGEVVVISVVSWIVQAIGQIRYVRRRAGHPWSWLVSRVVMSEFATVPLYVGGVLLFLDNSSAIYWLVAGFVFSFGAGVLGAWVLLVEILR
jgi:uncharacterized membrane protein YGL010W